MAARRIEEELKLITKEPISNCSAGPEDKDIYHWTATIL